MQAIGTRRLDQLNISNFEDYTKQLPSVSFQTAAPGFTAVYMRGVATGGDGNHSGSLPSVGFYLDEQPVTTIGGTLDVHIYDIARIESLAGPQGTLYGASSEAGHDPHHHQQARAWGDQPAVSTRSSTRSRTAAMGGSLEGMINLPIGDNIAFRAVAFYQRDAGYIDNVFGARSYAARRSRPGIRGSVGCMHGFQSTTRPSSRRTSTTNKTYGGRAALKIDLNENWTVTPTIMHQNLEVRRRFLS